MKSSNALSLDKILRDALGRRALPDTITDDTPLLGGVPGFDSLAVLAILTGIREEFCCPIAEHEVSADAFETVGTLRRVVEARIDKHF